MVRLICKRFPIMMLLAGLWFFNNGVFAQEPSPVENRSKKIFTLEDLYRKALENSETIQISEENVYQAETVKDMALSVLFPRLTAFGNYRWYSDDVTVTSEMVPGVTVETVYQPEWTTAWGVRMDQSFTLNGKELIALGISKDRIEKSKTDLDAVKEEYLLSVAAAYYEYLRADKAVKIGLANVRRLETHKQAVESRLKLEAVTKTALFRVQAELSKSRTDLINARNNQKFSRALLVRVVGLPPDFEIEELPPGQEKGVESDLNLLKEEALDQRAEVKSSKLQQKIAHDQVRFTKSAYWPTVAVEGVYMEMDQEPEIPYDESKYVEVTLNFTLFDGGLRGAEVREAKSLKKQADLALSDLEKEIAVGVEQAYLNLISARSTINTLDDQLTFSQANYDAVTKQFKFGLSDSVEVMDANTLLVTSENELSDARYRSQLALLRLERARGVFLNQVLADLGMNQEESKP